MSSAAISKFQIYFRLTKPTIVLLVAITGLAQMAADGSLLLRPWEMLTVLMAIVLSAASANAFNQIIDRDIDAIMARTKGRRPLPLGEIRVWQAFLFAGLCGLVSNFYLFQYASPLAAFISLATIAFYIFVYTIWLKRRHHYNIVIGGAAGATAPLIASAAAFGEISVLAWTLFLIIFFWTPPHFWALALALKDQYEEVKIPMLPNVRGAKRTHLEIWAYTSLLLPIGLAPTLWGGAGWGYGFTSILLWVWYLYETNLALRSPTKSKYMRLFFVSIFYLFLIFIAVGVDGVVSLLSLGNL